MHSYPIFEGLGKLLIIALVHFSASKSYICAVALVGGGTNPMPGEISLAHDGVLFLDELSKTTPMKGLGTTYYCVIPHFKAQKWHDIGITK